MPVIYRCDGIETPCTTTELAIVLVDDQGNRRLMPPYRWRVVDVELDGTKREYPAIICPRCGELYAKLKPPTPPKPVRKLGVIDGGKE